MRSQKRLLVAVLTSLAATAGPATALAAEAGFSVYGLGGSAFNAGITPPAGLYVTGLAGYYTGTINATATIGGTTVDAGAIVKFLQLGTNILYVPDQKYFGADLGLSITVPVGYVDLAATLSAGGGPGVSSEVQGPGFGDVNLRAQLGWMSGTFFNTLYVNGTLPTGLYQPGFYPSIGLNRPAIDVGWAFTYIEPESKIQFNATTGVTFNFENTATQYQSGTELHFEWALAKDFENGWMFGLVGYNYRQLTGDSGPGATLGEHKGSVDAVGLGLSYSTEINETPVSFALRHYREFNAVNRFEGSSTLATLTFAF